MRKLLPTVIAAFAVAGVAAAPHASATLRYCDRNLPVDVGCYSQPHEKYCDVLIQGEWCVSLNKPADIRSFVA